MLVLLLSGFRLSHCYFLRHYPITQMKTYHRNSFIRTQFNSFHPSGDMLSKGNIPLYREMAEPFDMAIFSAKESSQTSSLCDIDHKSIKSYSINQYSGANLRRFKIDQYPFSDEISARQTISPTDSIAWKLRNLVQTTVLMLLIATMINPCEVSASEISQDMQSFNGLSNILISKDDKPVSKPRIDLNDVARLKRGLKEISYLLDNWEEKTTYCNFGELQRDLLKTENKDKLLIAAAENSVFDYNKSATMNVMCRKDPLVVRAFVGLSDENPTLNRAESLMRKPSTIELIDEDNIDQYFEAVEDFSRAISEVDSLTYGARSDYATTETFAKGDTSKSSEKDYLQQSKKGVMKLKNALEKIVLQLRL